MTVTYLFQSLSGVTVEKTCLGERTLPLVAHPHLHGPLQREGKGDGCFSGSGITAVKLLGVCGRKGSPPQAGDPVCMRKSKLAGASMRQHVYFLTVDAIQPAAALLVLLRRTVAP